MNGENQLANGRNQASVRPLSGGIQDGREAWSDAEDYLAGEDGLADGPGGSLVFDVNAKLDVPHCDAPAWTMLGVSMAGYNALISVAMAIASAFVAFAPDRKR